MTAVAEPMPDAHQRLTQGMVWALVVILHLLALCLFARQAAFTAPVRQEQPLLVNWVTDSPAAGVQAAGPAAAPRHAAPPAAVKPVIKPAETVQARAMPNQPVVEKEKAADSKPAATDSAAANGHGDSQAAGNNGGNGNSNGAGNGNGSGSGASGGGTLNVSGSQLRFRHRVPPTYSPVAQERGYQGVARVTIVVDQSGQLQQAAISRSSGYAMLDEAAVSAARASSFYPYVADGVAHTVRAVIAYNFRLSRAPAKPPTEESS